MLNHTMVTIDVKDIQNSALVSEHEPSLKSDLKHAFPCLSPLSKTFFSRTGILETQHGLLELLCWTLFWVQVLNNPKRVKRETMIMLIYKYFWSLLFSIYGSYLYHIPSSYCLPELFNMFTQEEKGFICVIFPHCFHSLKWLNCFGSNLKENSDWGQNLSNSIEKPKRLKIYMQLKTDVLEFNFIMVGRSSRYSFTKLRVWGWV